MAKTFSIIKKENLLTGEKTAERFTVDLDLDQDKKLRLLKKYQRLLDKQEKIKHRCIYGEKLVMNLPDFSDELVEEISKHLYHTAYVVCKKEGKNEKVLYLSLLKDSALRFRNGIPKAVLKHKNVEYFNPKYFIKEVRLFI